MGFISFNNPEFKLIEFDKFKEDAGSNAYVFPIKNWTEKLGAIGLLTKSGRYDCRIGVHLIRKIRFTKQRSGKGNQFDVCLVLLYKFVMLYYDSTQRKNKKAEFSLPL